MAQTIAAVLVLLVLCLPAYLQWKNAQRRLPPGPLPLPIVGNVHQVPVEYQERTFTEWSKRYGNLVFAKLFRYPVLIVNDLQIARDLMEKRSGNFSDRPAFVLVTEMMGWEYTLSTLRYGDRFRRHRKWIQDALQTKEALDSYRSLQERETYTLLSGLVESPENYLAHFKRYVVAPLIEIAYGHRIVSLEDRLIEIAEKATKSTSETGSQGSGILGLLVDFFPILKHYPLWLPGSGFKVKLSKIREDVLLLHNAPYAMTKEKLASGSAAPSLAATLLEEHYQEHKLTPEAENDIKGIAGMIYAGGSDTTTATLSTFLLAMVRYPQVFKKAQAEIDRVIGTERLPGFDDRPGLSYIECIVKEVFRWGAPIPLGVPHCSMKSDEYNGYEIPAKTWIISNIWGMTRNAKIYPDPEEFHPERFEGLDPEAADAIDPFHLVFGFGRRQCPGEQFADRNIFMVIVNVIATMEIMRERDGEGREIVPEAEFDSGITRRPKPFGCVIRPRSEKAVKLIAQMYNSSL